MQIYYLRLGVLLGLLMLVFKVEHRVHGQSRLILFLLFGGRLARFIRGLGCGAMLQLLGRGLSQELSGVLSLSAEEGST